MIRAYVCEARTGSGTLFEQTVIYAETPEEASTKYREMLLFRFDTSAGLQISAALLEFTPWT